jgi:predicted RNA-binding Zn-ribbon protein involved in translation (DUF1610 family)
MYVTLDQIHRGELLACENCGTVGLYRRGWRSFAHDLPANRVSPLMSAHGVGHHCPACVDGNELIRHGLTGGVDPATAVRYHQEEPCPT